MCVECIGDRLASISPIGLVSFHFSADVAKIYISIDIFFGILVLLSILNRFFSFLHDDYFLMEIACTLFHPPFCVSLA